MKEYFLLFTQFKPCPEDVLFMLFDTIYNLPFIIYAYILFLFDFFFFFLRKGEGFKVLEIWGE